MGSAGAARESMARKTSDHPRICATPGCGRAMHARGHCDSHYRKLLEAEGRTIAPKGRPRPCAVHGCAYPHSAFGYCARHYGRFKRHGDPTSGDADRGAGLRFIEEALLMNTTKCILWPFGERDDAYGIVLVDGQNLGAHRYVCIRKHGPPPFKGAETCHRCATKRCINWRHVRWGTSAENAADRILHGTLSRGEDQWFAKLTESDVRAIRAAPDSVSHAELGRQYSVTPENIQAVRARKTWKHVA